MLDSSCIWIKVVLWNCW